MGKHLGQYLAHSKQLSTSFPSLLSVAATTQSKSCLLKSQQEELPRLECFPKNIPGRAVVALNVFIAL